MKVSVILAVMLLLAAIVTGCGGSAASDAPTATIGPQVGPGGPILRGLSVGRQVLAPDGRYSMYVPADWLEVNAGLAEVSYQSPPTDSGFTVSVTREQLSGIRQPQVYAEAGRRSVSNVYQNVLTLSMSPVQVGEVAAYRWLYTARVSGREQMYYQLFLIDGGEGFVVTGSAPATSDTRAIQALFDSVAGSINFARG